MICNCSVVAHFENTDDGVKHIGPFSLDKLRQWKLGDTSRHWGDSFVEEKGNLMKDIYMNFLHHHIELGTINALNIGCEPLEYLVNSKL